MRKMAPGLAEEAFDSFLGVLNSVIPLPERQTIGETSVNPQLSLYNFYEGVTRSIHLRSDAVHAEKDVPEEFQEQVR